MTMNVAILFYTLILRGYCDLIFYIVSNMILSTFHNNCQKIKTSELHIDVIVLYFCHFCCFRCAMSTI